MQEGIVLNFRKLRQDYTPQVLKEGKALADKGAIRAARILAFNESTLRVVAEVVGAFDHEYHCELELDRQESSATDTDCDCPSKYDCAHQAALIFHLEKHLEEMLVLFSQEKKGDEKSSSVRKVLKKAEAHVQQTRGDQLRKELLTEYTHAAVLFSHNAFFMPQEQLAVDKAELLIVFEDKKTVEIQIFLRLPGRSKPLALTDLKAFLEAVKNQEPLYVGSRRYFFTLESFDDAVAQVLTAITPYIDWHKGEKMYRVGYIEPEFFGELLAKASSVRRGPTFCFYLADVENPLRFSSMPATLQMDIEYLRVPAPKIALKPKILLQEGVEVTPDAVQLFPSKQPGLIHQGTYYPFHEAITRQHLQQIEVFKDLTIPEHLFGTFVENALPELSRFAKIGHQERLEHVATLPFTQDLKADCEVSYLDGNLEAVLHFRYGAIRVPLASCPVEMEMIDAFISLQGVLARNLAQEQQMVEAIFQDFLFDSTSGIFRPKNDKKIVEFMTEVVPKWQHQVSFHCPNNLLDRFIYDDTQLEIVLTEGERIDAYKVSLQVKGALNEIFIEQLWECVAARKPYIEIPQKATTRKEQKPPKVLVIQLDRWAALLPLLDELGIQQLVDGVHERPLWSLVTIDRAMVHGLSVTLSMSKGLEKIQEQMLGRGDFQPTAVPVQIRASLRPYQLEGVQWLERLRCMRLNGILADDMGLGKTLQAIIALTQYKLSEGEKPSLVVCPTSLVYNWERELLQFNPELHVHVVDGTPVQRKKLIEQLHEHDLLITSYSLLQKDIDLYSKVEFAYVILDEAQHIKNRDTRNARSAKMLRSTHRLILSGTPIENSLDELWSLFDFLMPGLLHTYDRFAERYLRQGAGLETLRRKVAPFVLRRMKSDVLQDLPPVTEVIYRCHLSDTQKDLYRAYAASARQELEQLVAKEGFEKVQIHVLATLTRLKQICCHPALFAKSDIESGDSAKYEMLLELVQSLVSGGHKTVIFSQYTRMLQIMQEDLKKLTIPFEYLDGASKDRMAIVQRFNEDPNIPIFLVSLKAGGTGLNLVGADTVIHYDLWWNPAVEAQATDRIHRIGQQRAVSSYKLVTLDSIEEKIEKLQNGKKELVRQVVNCDEAALAHLTWEEVLELLRV